MRRHLAERLGLLLLGGAVLAWSLRLSGAFGKSADQANLLLAGIDMLHGNWRLRGWSMVADPYWTSDVALGAVLSGLRDLIGRRELSPVTLVVQPALTWTALCMASIIVAWSGLAGPVRRWWAACIVLAVCFVPAVRATGPLPLAFLSGIHLLTLLYALAAFTLGRGVLMAARIRWRLTGLCGVAALGQAGDPLFLFVAALPLLIAAPFARSLSPARRLWLAGGVAAGVLAGAALVRANSATGGFTIEALPLEFASFGDLAGNCAVTLHGLLSLFSADFTGRAAGDSLPELLHLPLFVVAVTIIIGSVVTLWRCGLQRRFGKSELIPLCLALAAVIDVAALIVSRRFEYEAGSYATARYLFPAWVFAAILVAQRGAGDVFLRAMASAAVAASILVDAGPIRQTAFPTLSPDEAALLTALQRQPAHHGLAGYWQAALLQVASGGRLTLGACVLDAAGHLAPMRRANKTFTIADYTGADFFVVVQKEQPYFGQSDVVASFGPPARTQEVAGFSIMFYAGGSSGHAHA